MKITNPDPGGLYVDPDGSESATLEFIGTQKLTIKITVNIFSSSSLSPF